MLRRLGALACGRAGAQPGNQFCRVVRQNEGLLSNNLCTNNLRTRRRGRPHCHNVPSVVVCRPKAWVRNAKAR